jgi:hypothetical protein
VKRAFSLASAGLVLLTLTAGSAANALPAPINVRTLEVRVGDLPGFRGAHMSVFAAADPTEWAEAGEGSEAQKHAYAAQLIARGFQDGVSEFFSGRKDAPRRHREAVSEALVFTSEAGAREEFTEMVAQAEKPVDKHPRHRYGDPAIPGSVGLSDHGSSRGLRYATGNIFFTVGRCFFVVGDSLHSGETRVQGERPATVAATALYKRAKQACLTAA